jgi:hypothetical protein
MTLSIHIQTIQTLLRAREILGMSFGDKDFILLKKCINYLEDLEESGVNKDEPLERQHREAFVVMMNELEMFKKTNSKVVQENE